MSDTVTTHRYFSFGDNQIDKKGPASEQELNEIDKMNLDFKDVKDQVESEYKNAISLLQVGKMLYDPKAEVIYFLAESQVINIGKVILLGGLVLTNYGAINVYCNAKQEEFKFYNSMYFEIIKSIKRSDKIKYQHK